MKTVIRTFFAAIALLFIGQAGSIAAPAEDDNSCRYEEMCNPGEKCRQVLVCPSDDDSNDTEEEKDK